MAPSRVPDPDPGPGAGLSPDQQATLELLLGRKQTYAQLGELLGVEEAEVRERARAALAELGGADPDRNVALTDYLLGQADPITRADAVRHLREDRSDHELATTLVGRLRELVSEADLPRLPGEPRGGRFLRREPARAGAGPRGTEPAAAAPGGDGRTLATGLSTSQSRLLVALGAGAVILIAVVLALTGAFGAGNDGEAATAVETEGADEEVTRVALQPVNDGNATGQAVFGLTGADTIYLDLDIARLEPPGDEETYIVWLLLTPDRGWPLSPLPVGPNGSFQDRLAVPTGLIPLVARVRFVEVTLAPNERLERMLRRAPEQAQDAEDLDDFLLETVGRSVLRGTVPVEELPEEELEGLEEPGELDEPGALEPPEGGD